MSATPTGPETNPEVLDEETEATLRERVKMLEEDSKNATPWAEIKERILEKLKRPAPR